MTRLTGFASMSLSRARRKIDATGETFPFDFDQPVIATMVGTGSYPDGRVRPVYGSINSEREETLQFPMVPSVGIKTTF